MVHAPTRIEDGNVENLVKQMISAAKDQSHTLFLDLENVESITRSAGAILSNALLTDLATVSLEVIPPKRLPVEKILSSSLGFAFAHRTGSVSVRDLDYKALDLDRWRLPYTPARQRLPFEVDYEVPHGPSLLLRAHAAFVNPHETARRLHRTDVPLRVQSWLHAILPPRATEPEFLQDLHDLTYELVDNVAEHAETAGKAVKSIVHISIARGNASTVRDRIWVLVMDTGPGILATAVPKIIRDMPEALDDEEKAKLLRSLFAGDIVHGRARGLGLPRVASICARWQSARLEVLTDRWRLTAGDDSPELKVSISTFRVKGTVVIARFTTPPSRHHADPGA